MSIRDLSVNQIGLSNRAYHCLMRGHIQTVGKLLETDADSLLKIPYMGKQTLEEVLQKIEEYRRLVQTEVNDPSSDHAPWLASEEEKEAICSYLDNQKLTIDVLDQLSAQAYNILSLCGNKELSKVLFLSEEALSELPHMNASSVREIVLVCQQYSEDHKDDFKKAYAAARAKTLSPEELLRDPEYREPILRFAKHNDRDLKALDLSHRALTRLQQVGYRNLSDILFLKESDLKGISGMGINSVQEILFTIQEYFVENGERIRSICSGDESALVTDEIIRAGILRLYQTAPFGGLHFPEIREGLQLPPSVPDERIKHIVGCLLADGTLEYVDFCCYRVYPHITAYLKTCDDIDERSKAFLQMRLDGHTLEEIGAEYGLTRERVRQVVKKGSDKLHASFTEKTGMAVFDEAYYQYFYETYAFERKDGAQWFGISPEVFCYLDMLDCKRGKKPLEEAVNDEKLDVGLWLRVKNYLHRDELYLDGRWIKKNRISLENEVARRFARDTVSFEQFFTLYNSFLDQHGISPDEDLHFTDAVRFTRKNRLAESHSILWTQNERLRYYPIDSREYTELFDGLGLDSYENIELSTAKWFEENPDLMQKYDIRDAYELHNLLRKTLPKGSYHGFSCAKTPTVRFGTFDRDAALLSLMLDNAPIAIDDLCELIHAEYGYDTLTIKGSYLGALMPYYHQGEFSAEERIMPQERLAELKAALPDDFYFMDEVRAKYLHLFPDADPREINPFNLKRMGFAVFSRYILQHHSSLESYFRWLLTKEDMQDISGYRRRYGYVAMFSNVLMRLKRELIVIEYEPAHIITLDRLERVGVIREDMLFFCEAVYTFAPEDEYFSIQSLRRDGFESPLFELGFSDWFYANLLLGDERFSFSLMYGNLLFRKDGEKQTVRGFLEERIGEHGSMDMFNLMTELEERYGCRIGSKEDIYTMLYDSPVYYDRFLDRLYASESLYDREVAETEV